MSLVQNLFFTNFNILRALVYLILLAFQFCFEAKRVPYDINSPTGSGLAIALTTFQPSPTSGIDLPFTVNPAYPSGFQTSPRMISLTTSIPGSTIYYTLDGTTPTVASPVYTEPWHVWTLAGVTLKTFAVSPKGEQTPVETYLYGYPTLRTGQSSCYSTVMETCTEANHKGQDGQIAQGVGRSFIDNTDGTVLDESTGLLWQKCSMGQNNDSTCSGLATIAPQSGAISYCMGLTLASKKWRLPNIQELITLVHRGENNPTIFKAFFPATSWGEYWTSTKNSMNSNNAYFIYFVEGTSDTAGIVNQYFVHCVSGHEKPLRSNLFEDKGDGTIFDQSTGLFWQKCVEGQNAFSCEGPATIMDWSAALHKCNDLILAGKTWRVPNLNELNSLVDYLGTQAPLVDTNYFPNSFNGGLWSSTTSLMDFSHAWYLNFSLSSINTKVKTPDQYPVRCVSGP